MEFEQTKRKVRQEVEVHERKGYGGQKAICWWLWTVICHRVWSDELVTATS